MGEQEEEADCGVVVVVVQVLRGMGPCCGPVKAGVVERVGYSRSSVAAHQQQAALLYPLDLFSPGIKLTTAHLHLPQQHTTTTASDGRAAGPSGASDGLAAGVLQTVPVVIKPHAWRQQQEGSGAGAGLLSALLERVVEAGLYVAGARLLYLDPNDGHSALLPTSTSTQVGR